MTFSITSVNFDLTVPMMNINVQSYLIIDVLFSAGYFLKCSADFMMKLV